MQQQTQLEALRRRDEIYSINAMMRQRERKKFEEYRLATGMSDDQAAAMRLAEEAEVAEAPAEQLSASTGADAQKRST